MKREAQLTILNRICHLRTGDHMRFTLSNGTLMRKAGDGAYHRHADQSIEGHIHAELRRLERAVADWQRATDTMLAIKEVTECSD